MEGEKLSLLSLRHRIHRFTKLKGLLLLMVIFLLLQGVLVYKRKRIPPVAETISFPLSLTKFPQILHLMFPKSGSLSDPVYQAQLLLRFSRQQPNYNVMTYQYDDMLALIQEYRPDVAGSWFQMNQEEGAQFYFWKYALLYFRGGIWLDPNLFENLVNSNAWPDVLGWLFPTNLSSPDLDTGVSRIPTKVIKPRKQDSSSLISFGAKYCIFPDTLLHRDNLTKPDPDLVLTISERLDLNTPAPPIALFPFMPSFLISNQLMITKSFHPIFQRAMDMIQYAPPVNPAAISFSSFFSSSETLSLLDPADIRYGSLFLSHLLQQHLREQHQALLNTNINGNGEGISSKVIKQRKEKEFVIESYCLQEATLKKGNICCYSKAGLIPEQSIKSLLRTQRFK